MSLGIGENILKLLQEYNPWWRTKLIPKYFQKTFTRSAFDKAYGLLTSITIKRHVLLTGPRHVGKTTLIYQMIDHLLSQGVKTEQIFYISLDHPLLKLCSIETLISLYESLQVDTETAYIFIDEVQYAEGWETSLNQLYSNRPNWRFLCTSSVLPGKDVEKIKAKDQIVWSLIKIPTLSFYEYCQFAQLELPNINISSINDISKMDEAEYGEFCNQFDSLHKAFTSYLFYGGLPDLLSITEENHAQRVLSEEIIEKSLKCDIPALYKIRQPQLLDKVFLYICYQSGEVINIASMSRAIDNTPAITLLNYIDYLEKANLISICDPVSFDGSIIVKPRSRIYVSDPSIRNSILMLNRNDILINPIEQKLSARTLLCNHLISYYQRSVSRVGYHKKSAAKGIDFVAESPTGRVLIDFRYNSDTRLTHRDTLNFVANNTNIQVSLALLITKEPHDYAIHKAYNKKTVHRMPAHMFLYLLGLNN